MKASIKKIITLVFAIIALSFAVPTTAATNKSLNYFVIGVFLQMPSNASHANNFQYWKDQGANTLVLADAGTKPQKGYTVQEWDTAALNYGYKIIREPSGNYAYDKQMFQSGKIAAFSLEDEPDKHAANSGDWSQTTANQLVAQANNIRAQIPGTPIYATLLGYPNYGRDAWYTTVYSNALDIVGFDSYPINTGYAFSTLNQPERTTVAASGKAPLFYIETGDIGLKYASNYQQAVFNQLRPLMRAPTPVEVRAEMAQAVANGAGGIVFFPQTIAGNVSYDGTTPANAAVIKQETAIWKGLTADSGTDISGLPDGVVGRRRILNGSYKKIIVNTTTKTIKVGSQTYAPYEYKILNDNDSVDTTTGGTSGGNSGGSQTGNPGNTNGGSSGTGAQAGSLTASCAPTASTVKVGTSASWSATVKNGKYPLTYSWSGTDNAQSTYSRPYVRYTAVGTKQMSLTVTAKDGQTRTVPCSPLQVIVDPLLATCEVSVSKISATSARVRFSTFAKGGDRTYTYSWSGNGISSTNRYAEKIISSGGSETATVTITSGSQTKTLQCGYTLPSNYAAVKQVYGSCSASLNGKTITWRANGTSGWPYSYQISTEGENTTSSYLTKTYSNGGDKTASVTITSNSSSISLQCAGTAAN